MRRTHPFLLILPSVLVASGCLGSVADGSLSVDMAITDVLPANLPSRSGAEVTVLGKNFREGTAVLVDGVQVELVNRRDDGHLSFLAPPHAFGSASLTLRSPAGQEASYRDGLRYYAETLDFGSSPLPVDGDSPRLYAGYPLPETVLVDLDGDGLDDVVSYSMQVSAQGIQIQIDTLFTRDQGRRLEYAQALSFTYPNPSFLPLIRLGDVNGDGRADLLLGKELLLADSTGRLTKQVSLGGDGTRTYAGPSAIGDFDGDGKPELALTSYDSTNWPYPPASLQLQVFRIDSNGRVDKIRTIAEIPTPANFDGGWIDARAALLAADLDHDGIADLVWESADPSTFQTTLHARRGPDFKAADEWSQVVDSLPSSTPNPGYFQLLNATGGPGPDLLLLRHDTSGAGGQEAMLFANAGLGFGPPRAIPALVTGGFTTEPFNRLGAQGLSASWCGSKQLCLIRWANGLPVESSAWSVPGTGTWPTFSFGEFDGFPGPDVLTRSSSGFFAAYGVAHHLGTSRISYALSGEWTLPLKDLLEPDRAEYRFLVPGKFGRQGALAAAFGQKAIFIRAGTAPAMSSQIALDGDSTESIVGASACDVDADGTDDLVLSLRKQGTDSIDHVQVVSVHDQGLSLGQRLILTDRAAYQIRTGQFDRDGYCDLVVSAIKDPSAGIQDALFRGSRTGFVEASLAQYSNGGVFDFDGDGVDDLYGDLWDGDRKVGLKLLINDGGGTFAEHRVANPRGLSISEMAIGRRLDGAVDMVLCALEPGKETLRLWRGRLEGVDTLELLGSSEESVPLTDPGQEPCGLMAGDLNGDGLLDAIASGYALEGYNWTRPLFSDQIQLAGDDRFAPASVAPLQLRDKVSRLLDMNGDRLDDLAYITYDSPPRLGFTFNHSR